MIAEAVPIDNAEFIVNQYLPKIKYYAYKMSLNLPSAINEDDLVSAGVVGLIEAMERYDCKREASLKTFSESRIKGAIIDEIRSMQWASRDARRKINSLKDTYKSLEARLSRTPSGEEVAEELGISVDKLNKVMYLMVNVDVLLSLHDVIQGKNGETTELIDFISADQEDPCELFENKESRVRLARAIENLSEKERTAVHLYYYEGLKLRDIGAVLGLTESRICQMLNEAVSKMRDDMDRVVSFRDI